MDAKSQIWRAVTSFRHLVIDEEMFINELCDWGRVTRLKRCWDSDSYRVHPGNVISFRILFNIYSSHSTQRVLSWDQLKIYWSSNLLIHLHLGEPSLCQVLHTYIKLTKGMSCHLDIALGWTSLANIYACYSGPHTPSVIRVKSGTVTSVLLLTKLEAVFVLPHVLRSFYPVCPSSSA